MDNHQDIRMLYQVAHRDLWWAKGHVWTATAWAITLQGILVGVGLNEISIPSLEAGWFSASLVLLLSLCSSWYLAQLFYDVVKTRGITSHLRERHAELKELYDSIPGLPTTESDSERGIKFNRVLTVIVSTGLAISSILLTAEATLSIVVATLFLGASLIEVEHRKRMAQRSVGKERDKGARALSIRDWLIRKRLRTAARLFEDGVLDERSYNCLAVRFGYQLMRQPLKEGTKVLRYSFGAHLARHLGVPTGDEKAYKESQAEYGPFPLAPSALRASDSDDHSLWQRTYDQVADWAFLRLSRLRRGAFIIQEWVVQQKRVFPVWSTATISLISALVGGLIAVLFGAIGK